MPASVVSSADSFLVHVSDFAVQCVDVSLYPPPYSLRGSTCCCCTSFSSGHSHVLRWPLRRRFVGTNSMQLVLECYGGVVASESDASGDTRGSRGNELIGMCVVQMSHLMEANSSDCTVLLQLRDGPSIKGEVSFRVELQRFFTFTLRVTDIALVPPSALSQFALPLRVELLFGCAEDRDSCACCGIPVSVTAGLIGVSNCPVPSLLQWRGTLESAATSLRGSLCDALGSVLGSFPLLLPEACVAELKAGAAGCSFSFRLPLEMVGGLPQLSCAGNVTLLTDCLAPPTGGPLSSMPSIGGHVYGQGNSHPLETETCLPSGLRLMGSALQQHRETLMQVREGLARIRERKKDVEWQLEELHRQEVAIGVPGELDSVSEQEAEAELRACIELQQRLVGELAAVQERRLAATRERSSRAEERGKQVEEMLGESSSVRCVLQGARRIQEELQRRLEVEMQREMSLEIMARQQQELSSRARSVLKAFREVERQQCQVTGGVQPIQ
ncbi:hypothetical protein ERJ75_001368000 [Trypanosoma vivax]|uniref:Uncharacterized protein n=1 Tax=Trypanosoma vivax (strain Y486) TaxID=1055687 RepID=G0UCI5_TRYVY|nr:hypothetical protein ERJ75_001368000 [Trypanosoma vivax]CCC53545.1 conserved hypothetical protein [Trypanosoma vivax Y486]